LICSLHRTSYGADATFVRRSADAMRPDVWGEGCARRGRLRLATADWGSNEEQARRSACAWVHAPACVLGEGEMSACRTPKALCGGEGRRMRTPSACRTPKPLCGGEEG
jgi:hypothetical protein